MKFNVVVTGAPRKTKVKEKTVSLHTEYQICVYLLLSCFFSGICKYFKKY